MSDSARLDKYLWAIRAYKTRTEAADACNGNKVRIGGVPAKPSKQVRTGDIIEVRKASVTYTYKVTGLLDKRVGAPLVKDYAENLTPESELVKAHAPAETFFVRRDRGAGRPTKKERRTIDAMWDNLENDD